MATLADKALGTLIRVQEGSANVNYEIAGFNVHGANTATLVRKATHSKSIFGANSSYENSTLDVLCNETIYNTYPEKLRRFIKTTNVICATGSGGVSVTLPRRCFTLSGTEVGYGIHEGTWENGALGLYSNSTNRTKRDSGGTQMSWRLRSRNIYVANVFGVTYLGEIVTNSLTISQNYDVVPAFVLPSSRPLWDETNPDGSYNLSYAEYIDVDVPLGSLPDMPKAIRTMLQYQGQVTSLYVCNNYNDSSPVWEAILDNAEHVFTNTVKTASQWAVAVRVTIEREAAEEIYLNEFPAIVRC